MASDNAFPRPWLRVLWISGRNRLMVLASAANSGMRDRVAQDIHPASSCLPVAPLGREDLAELFFEQVGAVERVVGLGDGGHGGALVRSGGFFSSAHRLFLSAAASANTRPMRGCGDGST